MAASPELVFPFHTEMTDLLSWANRQKPDWKWRYYESLFAGRITRRKLQSHFLIHVVLSLISFLSILQRQSYSIMTLLLQVQHSKELTGSTLRSGGQV